jgi:hypothetical protein
VVDARHRPPPTCRVPALGLYAISGHAGKGDGPPVGPARPDAGLPRVSAWGTCRRRRTEAVDASSGAIGGKISLKEISSAVTLHVPLLFL